MYKAQVSEYKSDLEKVNKELQDMKKKYFAQVNQVYIALHPRNLGTVNSKYLISVLKVYKHLYFLKLLQNQYQISYSLTTWYSIFIK
jgi:hypothetical protein